jgi:XTP/dITP diphosphohydrolase
MEPFVLATGNPDKAREVAEVLADVLGAPVAAYAVEAAGTTIGFVVSPPDRLPGALAGLRELATAPDVEETGGTLEENARIKARGVGEALGMPAVADDTGLEVDALGGEPGVRSARFAGPGASYDDNVALLLRRLEGAAPTARRARFVTVALGWWPEGIEVSERGVVEGTIVDAPRGRGGFGYDPVFAPFEGDGRTFAEMSPAEKHRISHRGRAFRALAAHLVTTSRPTGG